MKSVIDIDPGVWQSLREHLLLRDPLREQAAFLFASECATESGCTLSVVGIRLVDAEDLAFHSAYHLELKAETWTRVIQDAYQRKAALIEVHSHLGDKSAEFSLSDLHGLASTVPHVAWRLKGRPFAALVLTQNDFDALFWYSGQSNPLTVSALQIGNQELFPTNFSWSRWNDAHHTSLRSQRRLIRC